MRDELTNMHIYYKLIRKWYIQSLGAHDGAWLTEVLCKRYAVTISNVFAAMCLGRNEGSEKSTQQIPTRNAKNDSQKLYQRKDREEAGLSEDNPGGTKLTSNACKESFFELEPKRLGPSRKRLFLWRHRDPREKLSLVGGVGSSQF